jgi:hypothetical protein
MTKNDHGLELFNNIFKSKKGKFMWRKVLITSIALVCLMVTGLFAQKNHYRKADHGLRKAYEHYIGTSLEEAIEQLIIEKRGRDRANGNVIVRFNGGGSRDKLYIGRKNTLEILVENDNYIQSASLGFEFSCTAGQGSFSWVQGYGSLTGLDSTVYNVVEMHNDGFGPYGPWNPQVGTDLINQYPSIIKLGGVAYDLAASLYINSTPTLLFSMQIELPDDPALLDDTFYIDNIYVLPACEWLFQEIPPGINYAPDFQWFPNYDPQDPTAPPVSFEIAEPRCEFAGKSTNPNIVYIPNDSVTPPPVSLDEIVVFDGRGNLKNLAPVRIGFSGDDALLKPFVLEMDRRSSTSYSATIQLKKLPQLCQLKGLHYIKPVSRAVPELNFSTDDINCRYSIIQDSLGVSGDSVIIGFIDRGLDWLHEDFIDSNGNTRIRYYWDQTDPNGPDPDVPLSWLGSEYPYDSINDFVQRSEPGRDYSGHGSHIAGVALANNRSGGSQSFVGVAPKANIIFVNYASRSYWDEAIDFIARRAAQLDMSWVINISDGLRDTPNTHRGDHPLEVFIDSLVTSPESALGKGRVIVKSAGNEGEDSLHASCYGAGSIDLDVGIAPGKQVVLVHWTVWRLN